MIKVLKAWLTKGEQLNSNGSNTEVIIEKKILLSDIINAVISDGFEIDKKLAMKFMLAYNSKVTEFVLTGNKVNTGLFSMYPIIKGQLHNKTWNPNINSINVSILPGNELLQGINETKVEIIDENNVTIEMTNLQPKGGGYDTYRQIGRDPKNDIPACGVAFRAWLCKA